MSPRCVSLLHSLLLAGIACAQSYTGTSHLVGDAKFMGDRIRLTPALPQRVGAVWLSPKTKVSEGFDLEFDFQLTAQGGLGGADGLAFVLQNQGLRAIAGRGSSGGFALGDGYGRPDSPGIPHSVAVFFDTFQNLDGGDPSSNYVAICTNGNVGTMKWPPRRLGVGKKLPVRLSDGRPHTARISYQPPWMTVHLDGHPVLRAAVDLSSVLDEKGFAYVGFTASTGNGWQNHDLFRMNFQPRVESNVTSVDSEVHFQPMNCLEGRNLCTPSQALVEDQGSGMFHIILPAHIPWAASIPNPAQHPVTAQKTFGHVCWQGPAG